MILPHDSVAARAAVENFCRVNELQVPLMDFRPKLKPNHYGVYKFGQLIVDALRCKAPSTSLYSWTWPGYTADLTVLGVTAHELGHHVNHLLGWGDVRRRWHSLIMGAMDEPPVGSYAASQTIEDFAESMKVFVTNPTLLECIAPKRYAFIVKDLRLKPVESRHWRVILEDSPRHIKAVENKL